MASVNIDFIKQDNTTKSKFLYSDIHLDLVNDYKTVGNYSKPDTQLVDIKISYDLEAVYNSLNALFNTVPGQRLLLPEYGIDLRSLLFKPISDGIAEAIGYKIKHGIDKWEPRVYVKLITVEARPDEHEYLISLEMTVPTLKDVSIFSGRILQGEGFVRT